jgi:hypothetical protein
MHLVNKYVLTYGLKLTSCLRDVSCTNKLTHRECTKTVTGSPMFVNRKCKNSLNLQKNKNSLVWYLSSMSSRDLRTCGKT